MIGDAPDFRKMANEFTAPLALPVLTTQRDLFLDVVAHALKKGYYLGARESLYAFAWYKNGEQYVGCGIKTYKQALEDIDREERGEKA